MSVCDVYRGRRERKGGEGERGSLDLWKVVSRILALFMAILPRYKNLST
jgi:hypothetical protein